MSVPSVPIHAPVSIHAAVLGTLLVDTFHQVPELHRVDFFFTGDVEVGPFEHGVQREVGSEADMLAEGRNHFFHGSNQFVAVAEVVQHDDASAWLADANHLVHDFAVIRYGSHDIGCHHGIEAVVGEVHFPGVHQHQSHMVKMIVRLALSGLRQHP